MTYIDPHGKLLWHIDSIAAVKAGRVTPPINVEIDLSNRCSLGCEWCHFGYTHTRGPLAGKRIKPARHEDGGDVMDTDLALDILAQLYLARVQSVTFAGGGEPTLHPDFDDIIEHCPLPLGIYTHGGHINMDRAALLKQRATWVYISLDEVDADSYQRQKGVNGFYRAMDGLSNLVAADGAATIGVGFLLHRNNWHQVPHMVELWQHSGADYVQFRPAVLYSADDPGVVAESREWVAQAMFLLAEYRGWDNVLTSEDRFEMYRTWMAHGYETCWWSALQTVITPNGKLWVCCNKREYPGAALGDLSVETFTEIWARHKPASVNGACRVLCRGHVPNLTLDAMMTQPVHAGFI